MTIADISALVAPFSRSEKLRFLARLSWELTIAARTTYTPGSDHVEAPSTLRALNEVQHCVTECLYQILSSPEEDVWIWETLADYPQVNDLVRYSCERAFQTVAGK